jgi:two-component system, LytTR family, response regulator LytT
MYNREHHIIPHNPIQGILIPVNRELVKILWKNIVLLEAADDYIKVHEAGSAKPYLIKGCLKNAEKILPSEYFCRVHRSYIVGIAHVRKIKRDIVNLGDKDVPLAKSYAAELRSRFIVLGTVKENASNVSPEY